MSTIAEVLNGSASWVVLKADCATVLPTLPPKCVDVTACDPPFSKHVHSLQRRQGGKGRTWARGGGAQVVHASLGFAHLSPELRRLCGVQFARLTRRWIIVKSDEEGRPGWQADLERAGARHVRAGTWWKVGAQPQLSGRMPAVDREALQVSHPQGVAMRWNGGGKHASWCAVDAPLTYRFPIATDRHGTGERVHTTQTPLALWLALVEDFTDPGDVVLDPFAGSGSLGTACLRLGRRYIGMDNGADGNGKPWADWAREGLAAEEQGLSRGAAKAGQLPLLSLAPSRRKG